MADELDEIRSRIRLVDLVSPTVNLKRSGKDFSGLCPFHDDRNPSFRVSDQLGRYKCWSCGESGDIFTWVMKTQNVTFPEAVEILARQAGVTLKRRKAEDPSLKLSWQGAMAEALAFFKSQLASSADAKAYCDGRGLSPDVLEFWDVGYAPDVGEALVVHLKRKGYVLAECQKLFLVDQDSSGGFFDKFRGRLIFPIRDEKGDLVAFGGRVLGDGHPKYINSSDTPLYRKSRVLYGMNVAKQAIAAGSEPILCEGYLDVIACHRAGLRTAVASLGTALSEDHARLLKRWAKSESVTVLYDADEAGQRAAARAADILEGEGLKAKIALMPTGEDPDTLLRTAGPGAVTQAATGGLSPTEFAIRQIEARNDPNQEAFWSLAAEALADCRNEFELSKWIQYLAAKHPDLKNPIEAARALRRTVNQRRRDRSGKPDTRRPAAPVSDRPKLGIKSGEATLFRAFLNKDFRAEAWAALLETDIFLTGKAEALGAEIGRTFPEAPPLGNPRDWLHLLQDEVQRQFLVDIEMSLSDPINHKTLEDSIQGLRRERDKRFDESLKAQQGDERLIELQRRFSRRHEQENA